MKHYSEADLLETYYTQPGESMPVMLHLAACEACASRYQRLEEKLRSLAPCEPARPETFWARQRIAIMRRVATERRAENRRPSRFAAGIAAAAAVVIVAGGIITFRSEKTVPAATETMTALTTASVEPSVMPVVSVPADPWESEELNDFQSVVAWESWVENGDQSL